MNTKGNSNDSSKQQVISFSSEFRPTHCSKEDDQIIVSDMPFSELLTHQNEYRIGNHEIYPLHNHKNVEKGEFYTHAAQPILTKQTKDEEGALQGSLPINMTAAVVVEESGRERLKRHRVEVAGQVWIPDIWGQEELLKDWIDCTAFDASLPNKSIMSARAALFEEVRNSGRLRIENRY